MRLCGICDSPAPQSCGGCGNVRVCEDKICGQFLVAGRNLKAGDLILDEEVGLLGPPSGEPRPDNICLGCYFPAPSYTCSTCHAPICGPSCEKKSDHTQECKMVEKFKLCEQLDRDQLYGIITPIRFLSLQQSNKHLYKKCLELSTNLETRRLQPEFMKYTEKARLYAGLLHGWTTEEEMLKILTILDTNTFQVLAQGSAETLSGLYPRISKLNHSCIPNSRTVFRGDYSLQIIACVNIQKGSPIYISYTPPFYTTHSRRKILERGKQFLCDCVRCQDPQELGTMMSGLSCGSCKSDFLLRCLAGEDTVYACRNCGNQICENEFRKIDETLLSVQTNIYKENVEKMQEILFKYSDILHPNHALLAETKQHLAAAIGRVPGYRYEQLDLDTLRLKVDISTDLLDILSILEPGISKSRGITLLDLTEAKSRLLRRECSSENDLRIGFKQIEQMLEESNTILSYEDEGAIEGNVAKLARTQLETIRLFNKALNGSR
ncbi:protein msta isoform X2 [Eurytemora carolleeae]|uniref:protein msta isoform X2 n=1 Tax=Eurytemora carolleeae TaxID=1294199 RepID=UPI000C758D22|nr:protein msta isoform X2 [Eurytemora carolleeae]|eukprot:XP_023319622.1 protein msta-like isoform X2 [Eurytemora affinis]